MRIAVIAANGKSGKAFVRAALLAGHTVRAGIHHHDPFAKQQGLEVMVCDATSQKQVEALLQGQDVVVSLLGHVKRSPKNVQTDAMKVITTAMINQHITRIISLTGTGVRLPGDRVTAIDKILNTTIAIIDPDRIADGKEHVRLLQSTSLDWTIVRVLKLTNHQLQSAELSLHGPTIPFISRDQVADGICRILAEHTYVRELPMFRANPQPPVS
jgi:putative NADH-flavin reductase